MWLYNSIKFLLICVVLTDHCLAFDPYKTLGIEKTATQEQIRKSYKKNALRYHPDKNKGDKNTSETFIKLNKAYNILKNPVSRAQYDRGDLVNEEINSGDHAQGNRYKPKPTYMDLFRQFNDVLNSQFGNKGNQDKNSKPHHHYSDQFHDFFEDDWNFDTFDKPHQFGPSSRFTTYNADGRRYGREGKQCRTITTNVNGVVTTYTECK